LIDLLEVDRHTYSRAKRFEIVGVSQNKSVRTVEMKLNQNWNKRFLFRRKQNAKTAAKRFSCCSQSQSASAVYGVARKQRGYNQIRLKAATVGLAFCYRRNKTVLFMFYSSFISIVRTA